MVCYGKYFNLRGSNGVWREVRIMDLHHLYSSENVVLIVMQKG
jgi:hypothetical protein